MKKFIISLFAVLALGIAANAANYSVDEASIDAMIEAAAEVSPLAMENASADLILHLTEQIQDLRLNGHIKRSRRLVGDNEFGVTTQCHGDHDTLTHTA